MMNRKDELDRFLASVEQRAFQLARIATNDTEEALDLVQNSMLILARKYGQKPEEQWRPLFYRIIQNQIRDWHRSHTRLSRWRVWLGMASGGESEDADPLEAVIDPKGVTPAAAAEGGDLMAAIERALTGLPLRQQQAFLLRAWEEFDTKETAAMMQCTQGSVKTHYFRAINNLKKALEGLWP